MINEIKLYAVPNTNPVVIRTYKWNGNKWNLISTSGGTGGGKGGGGGSPGGGGFGGGY